MDWSECRTHTLALGLAEKTFTLGIRLLCQSLDAYTVVVCHYYVVFMCARGCQESHFQTH